MHFQRDQFVSAPIAPFPSEEGTISGEKILYSGEFDEVSVCRYSICLHTCQLAATIYFIVCAPFLLCCPYMAWAKTFEIHATQRMLVVRKGGVCGNWGCFQRTESYIMFDRIQDLSVSQSCTQQCCGVEQVVIETAGRSGPNAKPEAVIYGLREPRRFRDEVLRLRHDYVENGAESKQAKNQNNNDTTDDNKETNAPEDMKSILIDIHESLKTINNNLE